MKSGEGRDLYSDTVRTTGHNPVYASIFISPAILPYFNQCEEMGTDPTYKITPRNPIGVTQVVVITIFIFKRVTYFLPFLFYKKSIFLHQAFILALVLASGKTEEIYVLILDHVKVKASRLPNAGLMVKKKCHADHELAIHNAFLLVIDGWIISCNFHYIQVGNTFFKMYEILFGYYKS